jgi:hypothetical protein
MLALTENFVFISLVEADWDGFYPAFPTIELELLSQAHTKIEADIFIKDQSC